MVSISAVKIKMFADGADLNEIRRMKSNPLVRGFTTNPTLMRAAGVHDFMSFAKDAIGLVHPLPISLEVFADDPNGMMIQAKKLQALGKNVYVKIPISNSKGESTSEIIRLLSNHGVPLNITAVFSLNQIESVLENISKTTPSIISVFAGRIADTGTDPVPLMKAARNLIPVNQSTELLWASPREILNVVQAQECGCDIITMTPDLWKKVNLLGKDLETFSLETVRMFFQDATESKFFI